MKFLYTVLFVGVLIINASAQGPTSPTVLTMENYKAHQEGWLVSLEDAYNESKERNVPILANFTGTDWCGWCIKLANEVFKHQEFKDWAKKNVVLLELDFPKRKKLPQQIAEQNVSLQRALGVAGYPTLFLFTVEKGEQANQVNINTLGKLGYVAGGPSAWIGQANQILGK